MLPKINRACFRITFIWFSLENKITIYKAIIKPVWTYGIELWGCSKASNTKILQTFQSKTLRKLANSPWCISNLTLHNDLRTLYVTSRKNIREESQKSDCTKQQPTNKRPGQSTWDRKKTQQNGSHEISSREPSEELNRMDLIR
jgi:hypothetical protein